MIFKSIFIGNEKEAYINEELQEGLNIISSNDNNKGKTIVMQGIMYCLGNKPVFPASFPYEDYYYILYIECQGELIKICRKGDNYVIKQNEEYSVFDNTAEFKRYWNKNIEELPIILKDNVKKIVDPELLIQVFFVGQDKKLTSDIANSGYYRKPDFYKLLYSMAGLDASMNVVEDIEEVKKSINKLKNEKGKLLKENKILKESNIALEYLSSTNDRIALENTLKEIEKTKNKLLTLKKERNSAISRRTKNEMALKELRSLNRTMKSGQIACLDCGSNHIAYESADTEFSFDISTVEMRTQILESVQEKIDIYNEEITRLTSEINICQKELDSCMKAEDIPLDALLIMSQELTGSKDADERLKEIEKDLNGLNEQLETKDATSKDLVKRQHQLMEDIISEMNWFYKNVDIQGKDEYKDIFTIRGKTYSGSEATEFHMAKMFAFQKVLKHKYPIVIDSFRAEDLSTDREERALDMLKQISNQIILTTTLKNEEENKYSNRKDINNIDFSSHVTNKMLSENYVEKFVSAASEMLVTIDI